MLTYEDISSKLLSQIRNTGLEPYNIKHNLEIYTLYKDFICNCVISGKNPPHITRAEISFGWDSSLTANSIYGNDCALYHDDSIDCVHEHLEVDAFIELYIKYNIKVEKEFEIESNTIYNELMKLFTNNMDHNNIPIIQWNVMVNPSGQAMTSSIIAEHYWEVKMSEDEFELENILKGIFDEVRMNLQSIEELPFIKRGY